MHQKLTNTPRQKMVWKTSEVLFMDICFLSPHCVSVWYYGFRCRNRAQMGIAGPLSKVQLRWVP